MRTDAPATRRRPGDQGSAGAAIRVLVADDSPAFRRVAMPGDRAQPRLRARGTAATSEEAVELTRKLAPELVLMDVRMPTWEGRRRPDARRRLRRPDRPDLGRPARGYSGYLGNRSPLYGEDQLRAGRAPSALGRARAPMSRGLDARRRSRRSLPRRRIVCHPALTTDDRPRLPRVRRDAGVAARAPAAGSVQARRRVDRVRHRGARRSLGAARRLGPRVLGRAPRRRAGGHHERRHPADHRRASPAVHAWPGVHHRAPRRCVDAEGRRPASRPHSLTVDSLRVGARSPRSSPPRSRSS